MRYRTKRAFRTVAVLVPLSFLPFAGFAQTKTNLVIQTTDIKAACASLRCLSYKNVGDPSGQIFKVSTPLNLPPSLYPILPGVAGAEADQTAQAMDAVYQGAVPNELYDSTPVAYYGTMVRKGYLSQAAAGILGITQAQSTYNVRGAGVVVAIIDTGVDTTHPVLQSVLLPGYDFTRDQPGADEKGDVLQSTTAVVDQSTTAVVDQSTTAVIDSWTAYLLNRPQYADFGHGTMVAGVVHLVAPQAMILPLKAFSANGTGSLSDVLQAIYYAVNHGARVLNMSFSFPTSSVQLSQALNWAEQNGVISIAAAGNSGQQKLVYPAGYGSSVIGVASTSDSDTLSPFSNYGPPLVWIGAPGEGVVTLYPYGTYAATWGTSFSAPFVSGTAALLVNLKPCSQTQAANAVSHAVNIGPRLGHGRLDLAAALQGWKGQ